MCYNIDNGGHCPIKLRNSMSREIDWKWLAGFWEGEGSIGADTTTINGKTYASLEFNLGQKEKALLEKIQEFLTKQNIKSSLTDRHTIEFSELTCGSRQAEIVIQKIYPFIVSERRKVQIQKAFTEVNDRLVTAERYYYEDNFLIAINIMGFEPKEKELVILLLAMHQSNKLGEVLGRNLRAILELTKESLFQMLEKLVQKNVLKFNHESIDSTVFIKAGEGYYIFNPNYKEWFPSSESLFYKLCKLLGYTFNGQSYKIILDELDLRQEIVKAEKTNDKKLTPYELYDIFCEQYKRVFNNEYVPPNQARDFMNLKKIIFDMSYKGYSDGVIKEFIKWCFLVKVREFKGNFIVGFLPMCLQDYLKLNIAKSIPTGFGTDENGRLKKNEG